MYYFTNFGVPVLVPVTHMKALSRTYTDSGCCIYQNDGIDDDDDDENDGKQYASKNSFIFHRTITIYYALTTHFHDR
jgi:hypothetical protein